jgi:hypothetical protein
VEVLQSFTPDHSRINRYSPLAHESIADTGFGDEMHRSSWIVFEQRILADA